MTRTLYYKQAQLIATEMPPISQPWPKLRNTIFSALGIVSLYSLPGREGLDSVNNGLLNKLIEKKSNNKGQQILFLFYFLRMIKILRVVGSSKSLFNMQLKSHPACTNSCLVTHADNNNGIYANIQKKNGIYVSK